MPIMCDVISWLALAAWLINDWLYLGSVTILSSQLSDSSIDEYQVKEVNE